MGFVNIANELICNQTLRYLQCKNGRYVSLLNFKKNLHMHELWSNFFYKCLNMKLCNWDELINMFAQTIDTSIRENGDQWIRLSAEYNILLLELIKKNSKFYP
uniref:Uncharacterized protein n=1 Tax=Wuchereria bancrofti TaxID=6293 RepID=A0A1I8EY74_WUCBA